MVKRSLLLNGFSVLRGPSENMDRNSSTPLRSVCDVGVLRLRERFATRSAHSAQDDQRLFYLPPTALFTRAASNSSPICQPTSFGRLAASHPSANPKRAIAASPVKSMSGWYSSLGWW
jgi:hypothetical protein